MPVAKPPISNVLSHNSIQWGYKIYIILYTSNEMQCFRKDGRVSALTGDNLDISVKLSHYGRDEGDKFTQSGLQPK